MCAVVVSEGAGLARDDSFDLLEALAFTVDYFGDTLSEAPMIVDLCIA